MHNLQLDGELTCAFGKFFVTARDGGGAAAARSSAFVKGEVLSSYTAQQRLQLHQSFRFVETLPDAAVPIAEDFLRREQFTLLPAAGGRAGDARVTFEGKIKRATDELAFELSEDGAQLLSLHQRWVALQQSFLQAEDGGLDLRVALRSRPALSRAEVALYTPTAEGNRIIELVAEDVSDVLPPEKGQVVYLSENSTRTFEKVLPLPLPQGLAPAGGGGGVSPYVLQVTETRRQPLIVLYDHEEDPRIEYTFRVALQNTSAAGGASPMIDIRSLGTEMLAIAERFREALNGAFVEAYGCTPIA
ncbi:hypothetical protein STCU_05104 [Strigomonas culicis]|uniref:RESC1/2 CYTH-like domain-containing protein n=1 Tax=Strigomonas culicis TaxID=28005 RepID=S9VMS0_9TRYP|nr:hypothetical protein STCU_06811 [Strigomonas culicis]EPY28476.1 hypothetical protein STCU_05104 [Strigomonas culicis]|eukprot:EPY25163.1 hypothetical protein STCU_06811 [Strigomonas culicis]